MVFYYLYKRYKRKQAAKAAEAAKAAQAQDEVDAVTPALEGSSPALSSHLDSPKSQSFKTSAVAEQATEKKKKTGCFGGLQKEQWMLMGALALPVFLETLDYTGKSALMSITSNLINRLVQLLRLRSLRLL